MNDVTTSRMALLHSPEIIVHNTGKTTLRGTLMALGIKTITIEIGNPSVFQEKYIKYTLTGVREVMRFLTMIPMVLNPSKPTHKLTICSSSYWIYTDTGLFHFIHFLGGILNVIPPINTWVKKGELIADVHTIFGKLTKQYFAPEDGSNSNFY
jgi:predicted deacylase